MRLNTPRIMSHNSMIHNVTHIMVQLSCIKVRFDSKEKLIVISKGFMNRGDHKSFGLIWIVSRTNLCIYQSKQQASKFISTTKSRQIAYR